MASFRDSVRAHTRHLEPDSPPLVESPPVPPEESEAKPWRRVAKKIPKPPAIEGDPAMPADTLEGAIARLSVISDSSKSSAQEKVMALREITRLRKLGEVTFRKDLKMYSDSMLQDAFFSIILPQLRPYIRSSEVREERGGKYPSQEEACDSASN